MVDRIIGAVINTAPMGNGGQMDNLIHTLEQGRYQMLTAGLFPGEIAEQFPRHRLDAVTGLDQCLT